MSFFPSPVLVRLQELKLWQGNYDSLLRNKSKDGANPSDLDTIEGLSALDSNSSSAFSSPEKKKGVDWDKKEISPSKPFDQLLEEKLALDKPVQVQAKPKRPFLKKGSGLTRYKLNQPAVLPRKRPQSKPKATNQQQPQLRSYSAPVPLKSCLKTPRAVDEYASEPDITPLKMPDVSMKPKATWQKVLEEEHVNREEKSVDQCSKGSLDQFTVLRNDLNSHILEKINDFNLKRYLLPSPRKTILQRTESDSISTIPEVDSLKSLSDESPHEKSTENELRIFEALEERVEHSSFSSTNSSIIRLLSSTPNKAKNKPVPSPIFEEHKENDAHSSQYNINNMQAFNNSTLQQKLQEVNKRTDVLHDFLKNLRKMGKNSDRRSSISSAESSVPEKSPETSFSDEEKWSSNTDIDRSHSPSSSFTDTFKNSTLKVDVAVNTDMDDENARSPTRKCENCAELQTKLEKLSKQLPDIQAEKAKVCDFAKELEAKRDQLYKEMEKLRRKHEEEVLALKEEIDNEKRKFAREKMVFDMYMKDSHNRPSRKEREQITELKKELADCKELLKLKETKNGATQARLRTQVKQLEKENCDLKRDVEKLQKDNAKLTASQMMRKPSEVKMLHEINRNLTKLTEETLKSKSNRTDTSCNTDETDEPKKRRSRRSKEADAEISPRARKNSISKYIGNDPNGTSNSVEDSKHELTTFANLSLERQYENAFKQFLSPGMNNNSLNDSKKDRTETVFEDGSKEIRYSNGNTKTISPDGNQLVVKYYNGDIKETNLKDNTLKYYYAENGTWHTQFGDGTELLEYPNGQKEKTYPDGKREVKCADGSVLFKNVDGSEEILYPDGSKLIKKPDGEKILHLPNGQKEVHTKEHKRREYPDGTVKLLYPDGMQETRYASGRIRIKDSNGVLIMDTQSVAI